MAVFALIRSAVVNPDNGTGFRMNLKVLDLAESGKDNVVVPDSVSSVKTNRFTQEACLTAGFLRSVERYSIHRGWSS